MLDYLSESKKGYKYIMEKETQVNNRGGAEMSYGLMS